MNNWLIRPRGIQLLQTAINGIQLNRLTIIFWDFNQHNRMTRQRLKFYITWVSCNMIFWLFSIIYSTPWLIQHNTLWNTIANEKNVSKPVITKTYCMFNEKIYKALVYLLATLTNQAYFTISSILFKPWTYICVLRPQGKMAKKCDHLIVHIQGGVFISSYPIKHLFV